MASVRLSARLIAVGGCAAAVAVAPAIAVFASTAAAPRTVADCPGDINIGIINEGAPVQQPSCPVQTAPGPPAGAPSEQILTQCSGIPGCLSNSLYGPGYVQVPRRDTRVQQSQ
jgi:hypothetical protein